MPNTKSLRSGITLRLIVPMIMFVAFETALSYFVALHYVDLVYDRWLLDSARSLAQEIKVEAQHATVELPRAAVEIFKWDDMDQTYFKIIAENQGVLAGDAFVPEPFDAHIDWSRPVFFNDQIRGQPVRVVSMLVARSGMPEKVFVHVAETLNKRGEMITNIVLADLGPQMLLTLLVGFYLLNGITRGLQPLQSLANEIAQRSPRDLSPIPENQVLLEVRTLTDTINRLFHSLATAIESQQRFIANAAHQLRTPLAGLQLQAERALRENDLAAMQPALLQMQSSAERMSHLISQLLLLARAEPVEGGDRFQPLDLCALTREVCIDWAPKALQRGMELSFEGPQKALTVRGDKVLLRELLANLLDNAITYGRKHGNISVNVQNHPAPALIVSDDGPGIPPAEQQKVFERFYRIQGSSGEGCGLGLAIVKEIAELHQARLKLERLNAKGGTRIEVSFAEPAETPQGSDKPAVSKQTRR